MTLRAFILLITAPVFLLLGLANAILLYSAKHAVLEAGIREQARAAAVTLAAFARESNDDLAAVRTPGARRRDLADAARQVPDLESIGLVRRDGSVLPLYGRAPTAVFLPRGKAWIERRGDRPIVQAVEPVSADSVMTVALDGRSYRSALRNLLARCTAIATGVALAGVLVSLWLVRRFRRELRAADVHMRGAEERLSGRDGACAHQEYSLGELAELVHAVDVMEALGRNALHERPAAAPPPAQLFASHHLRDMVPEVDQVISGRRVAARMLGAQQPGALIVAMETAAGGSLLLARFDRDDPGVALCLAQAVRPLAEAWLLGAIDEAEFRRLAGRIHLERIDWGHGQVSGQELHVLAPAGVAEFTRRYQALGAARDAAELLDQLAVLLPPDTGGLFAVTEAQPAEASAASASS